MLKMLMLATILSSGCVSTYHKDSTIDRELASAELTCTERAMEAGPKDAIIGENDGRDVRPLRTQIVMSPRQRVFVACMRTMGYAR